MLIPPELYSGYQRQQQDPEVRLKDDIIHLLDRENIPDDAKAKILGHLITRFQKVVHEPMEPIRVSMANSKEEEEQTMKKPVFEDYYNKEEMEEDPIMEDILQSVPRTHTKFIPLILEKLKTRLYSWNADGEFVKNNTPIKNSKIVDFFSYIMRNIKRQEEPLHFNKFLPVIKEINIPISWIGNPKVVKLLQKKESSGSIEAEDPLTIRSASTPRKRTSGIPRYRKRLSADSNGSTSWTQSKKWVKY